MRYVPKPRSNVPPRFLTLDSPETNNCKRPTFGCRLSLRKHTTNALLNQLEVRAEFISLLLGQPVVNFLPSASFETFDGNGQLQKLDFICQQPWWGFGHMQWPVSIWTSLEKRSGMTTCLITAASHDQVIEAVQTRLTFAFDASSRLSAARYNAADPLFVPTLISHECFMQSDSSLCDLDKRLNDSIDIVDAAAETPYDRNIMKSLTFKLHQTSQEADFLIHSADAGIALMDSLRLAQERLVYFGGCREKQEHSQSINAADYLKNGVEARKRWLLNTKTRKETAMSLVYNLVSQKEAETNMGIAQDTRNDSSSMKVIAALTMVFLPASAVSSFFGMAFFDGQAGNLTVTNEWWMFLAVTVPLTTAVVIIWRLWGFFGHRAPSSSPKRLQDFKTRQTWFRLFTGSPRVDWINGEKGPHEV
ncbi:hypothetical protein EPUS_04586 [Endocarpon pusillum Z07020]|uniref:Uncharacterized protein n=1 Tax=Endocarpon pusillum (strain Z07020 / HMAS-L-300199) TaxID=1263415 RepID=U1GU94_ENDPU|nr:uncharacterized protein EPUS_04586 [Endocarpon pusillum Z07020]ERF75606.1 hypothetical protein EPUS_04586 [Endocarpon pusillum Z07020]